MHTLPFDQWGLGLSRPLLIAGPCSAESAAQMMATAEGLAREGRTRVLRAGAWKPRTRPGTFEGAGREALQWLRDAGAAHGMLTMTEVATAEHVEASLEAGIDMLWIGARTTPNPFSVQEVADALRGVDIPVFVKNPINPDLQLWVGALERLHAAGLRRLAAVHRGFNWFGQTPYRNNPMWEFPIRLMAAFPGLEVLCDPSHIAGDRERLDQVAQQALDLNMSGLMVEVHHDPDAAWSDAGQQLTPRAHGQLVDSLLFRQERPAAIMEDRLQQLRDQIDQLDEEIAQKLSARMEIAARIGDHKHAHNVAIVQPERWERIMARQLRAAQQLGLSRTFVEEFMDAIHHESIRRQTAAWELTSRRAESVGSPASAIPGTDNANGAE